jgi:hypothetical protein
MPKFTSGSRYVEYQKITWAKIEETTGFAWRDGYDRLFTIYMPAGLEDKVYKNYKFFRARKSVSKIQ